VVARGRRGKRGKSQEKLKETPKKNYRKKAEDNTIIMVGLIEDGDTLEVVVSRQVVIIIRLIIINY